MLLYKKILSVKAVVVFSIFASGILFLSYNAFSYDLFNYIFDAKIITEYGDNPYERKALDYPEDPSLGFMRWTHRVYPYGPVWLLMSVPLSYASMGSLLLNMILFKGIALFSYLGSVLLLKKIIEIIGLKRVGFHLGLFALHPLVIVESLVSAHNDIVMMFFLIIALYLLVSRKYWFSLIPYGLSIGVKFATAFLLPVFFYVMYKRGKITDWQPVITLSFICMFFAVLAASYRSDFLLQPWYLLYIFPFMALSLRKSIIVPTLVVSLFAFFQYFPYIFFGHYDPPISFYMALILSGSFILAAIFSTAVYFWSTIKR